MVPLSAKSFVGLVSSWYFTAWRPFSSNPPFALGSKVPEPLFLTLFLALLRPRPFPRQFVYFNLTGFRARLL